MSYIVMITQGPVVRDDRRAWENLEESIEKATEGDVPIVHSQLIDRLTAKFPCICDLDDDQFDDGVWTDGPLRNNAGHFVTVLGIVPQRVDEVLPFLIEVSNGLGLFVFDQQSARIHRPAIAGKFAFARAWWKFWA
ncbi:hypothetical protein GC170_13795 [bacterium]|nr:hypothetical protein [bacterium]